VLDVQVAMKSDAPLLHSDLFTDELGEQAAKPSNVAKHFRFQKGDLAKGFAKAKVVVEREFRTATVHQGYIEPQNATALWNADGHLTVWTSTQGAFTVRQQVAELVGLPISHVKVIPMEIGGGFGGKEEYPSLIALHAALLAGPKGWFEEFVMKSGGAKGVNAILAPALDESPLLATLTVGGPLQEEDMVKLAFRQIKKAALLPLHGDSAPDLVYAKTLASGGFLMGLDSDPSRALQFGRAELFGLGIDYPIVLPAKIDGITSDDLLRIGLKYFQKDQWTRAAYSVCETRPGGW
jgi:hypothetical protein